MAKSPLCAAGWALWIACCIGCGGDGRPPLLTDEQPPVGVDDGDAGKAAGGQGASSGSGVNDACKAMRPFDPAEVYVIGSLSQELSGWLGIAPSSDPNVAFTGFDNLMSDAVVRPSDGSLLFAKVSAIYNFTPDQCVSGSASDYPAEPLKNDGKLTEPAGCAQFRGLRLAPNGGFLFHCSNGWITDGGQTVDESYAPFLAYDGERILTERGVFDVARQSLHAFANLPASRALLATRVQDNGFWLVTSAAKDNTQTKLWLVNAEGEAQLEGDYPDPPADPAYELNFTAVAGDGSLIQIGIQTQKSVRTTIMAHRTIDGEFTVVYDEGTNPLVKLTYPQLITGP